MHNMAATGKFVQKNKEILYFGGILVIVFGLIPLVSADEDYSQGWLGAPNWVLDRTDTSILPDFYYPKNISGSDSHIPPISSSINKGNELLSSDSFLEAKQHFEEAIRLNPRSFDAWLGRGYALEQSKRYQSAVDSYQTAISLSGNEESPWAAYAGLGRVSLTLGQYKTAEQAFQTAIEMIEEMGSADATDMQNLYDELAEARQKQGEEFGGVFTRK
jgi:tetratricopeptide (TPR) repeat protein